MSDFFTRLAERVLGVSEIVRPTTTPLFAPGPPFAIAPALGPQDETSEVEHQADVGADPASTLLVAPVLRPHPGSRLPDHDVNPSLPGGHKDDASPSAGSVESGPVARSTDVVLSAGPVPDDLPDAGRVVPTLPFTRVLSAGRDPLGPATRLEQVEAEHNRPPVAVELQRIVTTERVELAGPNSSRSSDTTIRVTIGRVEVKAVVVAQPPARPRVAPRPPMLSLEDYLRQRNNGQR
jgi:hypothetical protein